MIFLLLPALGVMHAFAYPMYIDLNGENAYLHGEAMKAFEIVLLDFKITKGISVLILFGGLFLALYFGGKLPDEKNSLAITPIPAHIKEGEKISSIPIEINIAYEKKLMMMVLLQPMTQVLGILFSGLIKDLAHLSI